MISNKHRYLFFSTLLLLIPLVNYLFNLSSFSTVKNENLPKKAQKELTSISPSSKPLLLFRDLPTIAINETAKIERPEENKSNVSRLFEKEESIPLPHKEGISPLCAVELQKERLLSLEKDSTILLPEIGSIAYHAKITEKKLHLDGSTSLIGELEDEYERYAIIITLGEENSFATFHTPEGSFELEAEEGLGYIYAIKDIDNGWIDYTQEDTLPLGSSS